MSFDLIANIVTEAIRAAEQESTANVRAERDAARATLERVRDLLAKRSLLEAEEVARRVVEFPRTGPDAIREAFNAGVESAHGHGHQDRGSAVYLGPDGIVLPFLPLSTPLPEIPDFHVGDHPTDEF